ncbi:MAG: cadherin-like beta sandwich domain-containing protein [Oscillospiraceae bacterium]
MNDKKRLKQILSGCMACVMCALSVYTPVLHAAAADEKYYIKFLDDQTMELSQTRRIVEGTNIRAEKKLPANFIISTEKPFMVTSGGVEDLNSLTITGEKSYIVQANANSAGVGTDAKTYVLKPQYTSFVTTGAGLMSLGEKNIAFDVAMKQPSELAITIPSAISFTATEKQSDTGAIYFSKANTATGDLSQYKGATVAGGEFAKDEGGMKYLPITIEPVTGERIILKAYINSSATVEKDTVFKITFNPQTINELALTVITPLKAVNELVNDVVNYPVFEGQDGKKEPYVQLAEGDSLSSIRTPSFGVVSTVHQDNVDIKLTWAWEAADSKYQNYVKVKTLNGKTSFVVSPIPEEDMAGNLTVKAEYKDAKGNVTESTGFGKIPVLIYGTGISARFTPNLKWTGDPGKTPPEKVEAITEIPKKMDVYNGAAEKYPENPVGPYKFSAALTFGSGRGTASKVIMRTTGGQGEDIEVRLDGSERVTPLGTEILNKGTDTNVEITAKKSGQIHFIVEFYDDLGALMTRKGVDKIIEIRDSSPNTDASLDKMDIELIADNMQDQGLLDEMYPNSLFKYSFAPLTNKYDITVPNKATKIKIKPRVAATDAIKTIDIEHDDGTLETVQSGAAKEIALPIDALVKKTFTLMVTAESGLVNKYIYSVTRDAKSTDSSLKLLQAFDTKPAKPEDLIKGFSAVTKEYDITVPYSVEEVELAVAAQNPWAQDIAFNPLPVKSGFWIFAKKEQRFKLECQYDPITGDVIKNVNTIIITVTAEDGSKTEYTVNITRNTPSTSNKLKSIVIKDKKTNQTIPFDANLSFTPDNKDYYITTIPYSAKELTIEAQQEDNAAVQKISLIAPSAYGSGRVDLVPRQGKPVLFNSVDISQTKPATPAKNEEFTYTLKATAESGAETDPPYSIHFKRMPANGNAYLSSINLKDQDGKDVTEKLSFNTLRRECSITVPFLVTSLMVTPKAASELSLVNCDGNNLSANRPSVSVDLSKGRGAFVAMDIPIIVTAEDESKFTYMLHIEREAPNANALLKDLTLSDKLLLTPKIFDHNRRDYSVVIPLGTKGFTVTPTAEAETSTITVNGKKVQSGTASEKIVPLDAKTTVVIEVTAQSGTVKEKYTIAVQDENRIEKSDDANLLGVKLYDGALSPRFNTGITKYEIGLKPNARSLDITPRLSDPGATIKVLEGERVLESFDGKYFTDISNDETTFSIEVTSSDKEHTKKYTFTAYRNNEEKEYDFKPIAADAIDFTAESPIRVDISKYAVVMAEVFNKLKTEYPDKSIIFEGNGYSLEIAGKDIKTLVPNNDRYDFSMRFDGPNNQRVKDLIIALDGRNASASPVVIHFGHHGALPAPMLFRVSLGGFYKNLRMYWNYFNEPFNSMDYYGYLSTNAQGTCTVPVTHMSDYAITPTMVFGSENKVGALGTDKENLGGATTSGKRNPQTSVKGKE